MTYDKIVKQDIKESVKKLRDLRKWLELNIENLTLPEFKKVRTEIEKMEVLIEINK